MVHRHFAALLAGGAALVVCASPVAAQSSARQTFDIPAQALGASLRTLSLQTGQNILAPADLVGDRKARNLKGRYTVREALTLLLAGTGLRPLYTGGAIVIERDPAGAEQSPDIIVTGSRIRNAPVAAPVIRLEQRTILDQGQSTVAEAARSIPQNFGGGQNPGIGNNVPGGSGVNVGSASSINLRGLGSDATLTLINGHRLSYSASRQAVDISTIPLGAVDRIEVVPDGASALYGSDAVAGVANIILKRDFDGVETSARLGAATEGGDFEQRYGITAGRRWTGGGVIATYEFGRTSAIDGRDRAYTQDRPSLTLLPLMRNHSVAISGHQDLLPGLTLSLDALYNDRFSSTSYALDPAGDIRVSGGHAAYSSRSFVLAPTLAFDPGGGWRSFLTGSYGQDHTRYDVTSYSASAATRTPGNCYCNDAKAVELGGDGPLFRTSAGVVRLAIGAGYRTNHFVRYNGAGASTNVAHDQDSYYGYGELSVPLIGAAQSVPLVQSLSLSGAARYERYPGEGSIVTPKAGLIWTLTGDVSIKGSWGKSFRAPTLYQKYQSRNVVLLPPSLFGGTGYAAGATALLLQGGNASLRPERATSWSATLDLHPRALDGAKLELSYFSTRYRDRIVTPITFLSQALSNPLYANRVLAGPSAAFLSQIVASAISFGNATGAPYDPGKVAVFVDNSNVNAGRQTIHGIDALLSWRRPLGPADSIGLTLDGAYLESDQQLGAGLPVTQLAGVLFNPPHFRARGSGTWTRGGLALTFTGSYIGGVDDTRTPTLVRVGSMTTFDLAARYRMGRDSGVLAHTELILSLQNMFDVKPSPIATSILYDAPYDSTNQSPVGRFVSLSVTRKW